MVAEKRERRDKLTRLQRYLLLSWKKKKEESLGGRIFLPCMHTHARAPFLAQDSLSLPFRKQTERDVCSPWDLLEEGGGGGGGEELGTKEMVFFPHLYYIQRLLAEQGMDGAR